MFFSKKKSKFEIFFVLIYPKNYQFIHVHIMNRSNFSHSIIIIDKIIHFLQDLQAK